MKKIVVLILLLATLVGLSPPVVPSNNLQACLLLKALHLDCWASTHGPARLRHFELVRPLTLTRKPKQSQAQYPTLCQTGCSNNHRGECVEQHASL